MLLQENPPPGSYDVDQSFKKSQLKHVAASPRTESAKKRHYAFQISASRFVPPRDIKLSEADPLNPGQSSRPKQLSTIRNINVDGLFYILMTFPFSTDVKPRDVKNS